MNPMLILDAIEMAAATAETVRGLIEKLTGHALAQSAADGTPAPTAEDVQAAIERGRARAAAAGATGQSVIDRLDREGK